MEIEKIRKDAIEEIKEKVRKNPNFLSPVNKERLECQEKLKFANGNDFTHWMQQNGIMNNPVDIERKRRKKVIENAGCKTEKEYQDKCARDAGFKDKAERYREWMHDTGRTLPKEFNEDCPIHFGEFTENLMIQTFEDPIKMPPNNPGFDWKCRNGDKVDNKGRCLDYDNRSNWSGWIFSIRYNDVADIFILSAWDNRDSLNPLHVWIFHKNDIIRKGNGAYAPKVEFWKRDGFTITNTPEGLKEFEKHEATNRLDKLKELCGRDNKGENVDGI